LLQSRKKFKHVHNEQIKKEDMEIIHPWRPVNLSKSSQGQSW